MLYCSVNVSYICLKSRCRLSFTKNDVGIKFNVYSRVPETLRFEVWAPPGFEVWLQGSGTKKYQKSTKLCAFLLYGCVLVWLDPLYEKTTKKIKENAIKTKIFVGKPC